MSSLTNDDTPIRKACDKAEDLTASFAGAYDAITGDADRIGDGKTMSLRMRHTSAHAVQISPLVRGPGPHTVVPSCACEFLSILLPDALPPRVSEDLA